MTLDKLSRTDLIKMIGQQVLDDLKGEADRARTAADEARSALVAEVGRVAIISHKTLLINIAAVADFDAKNVVFSVPRQVYVDQALPESFVCVLSNSGLPHDQRFKLDVRVPVGDSVRDLALGFQRALQHQVDAERRDTKVTTIREKVRKDLVGELLKGDEGEKVLAAAKELARSVKGRLLA